MSNAVTEAATQAIGAGTDDDWVLALEAHASELPPEAGALRRVLERSEIQEIIRRYMQADRRALKAQARYHLAGKIGVWARVGALTIGAVALVVAGATWLSPVEKTALIVLQAVALATSYLSAYWIKRRRSFLRWMEARGEAELARTAFFDAVTAADEPTRGAELALAPLQIEYFRRYQLDVQKAFYTGRGRQHLADARRSSFLRYALLALVALAAVAVVRALGVTDVFNDWNNVGLQRLIIAFMTVASAIQSAFADVSLMELNERNAARYAATAANLGDIEAKALAPARAAAAESKKGDMLSFCASVNDELGAEHRAWAALRTMTPRPEDELLKKGQLLDMIGG
jgi:hypothetical protein